MYVLFAVKSQSNGCFLTQFGVKEKIMKLHFLDKFTSFLYFYIHIYNNACVCLCVLCPKFINKLAINIRHFVNIVIDIRDEIMHILMDSTTSTTE